MSSTLKWLCLCSSECVHEHYACIPRTQFALFCCIAFMLQSLLVYLFKTVLSLTQGQAEIQILGEKRLVLRFKNCYTVKMSQLLISVFSLFLEEKQGFALSINR